MIFMYKTTVFIITIMFITFFKPVAPCRLAFIIAELLILHRREFIISNFFVFRNMIILFIEKVVNLQT